MAYTPFAASDNRITVETAPSNVDWSTVQAQLGEKTPPPMEKPPADPTTRLPQLDLDHHQGDAKPFGIVSLQRDFLYANIGFLSGYKARLEPGHSMRKGIGIGLAAAAADTALDPTLFKNTEKRMPSTITDLGASVLLLTLQPAYLKVAEMVGLHAVGRLGDKFL